MSCIKSGGNPLFGGLDEGTIQDRLENSLSSNLGGIFSARPTAKFMTGARAVLKINGELIGFAFEISWNISTDHEELFIIDQVMPHELMPKKISVSGTLGMLHIPGQGPTAKLYQADVLNYMFNKYVTIEVRDSQTDTMLFYTGQAMIVGRSESLRAENIAEMSLQWKAIGWQDERDPTLENKEGHNLKQRLQDV